MTTVSPARTGAPAPPGPAAHPLVGRLREGRWQLGLVTALATLASALCLQPLLDGGWWVPPTAVTVAAVALVGGLTRMLRAPAPLQPIAQALALLGVLTAMFASDQARWGFLPGPAALGRLQELIGQGRQYAMDTAAPAGPDEGLLLLVVGGVGLAALVADSLAGGLDLPGLALIPLATMFAVPWLAARGGAPTWAFVLVALAWLAVLSSSQRERTADWSEGARPPSGAVGIAVSAVTITLALAAGSLVGLRGPVGPLDLGRGASGAVQVDAMVSLRRSLVSNDDRVILSYSTDATRPDYLRTAVLEQFDGEVWTPAGTTFVADDPPSWASGGRQVPALGAALVQYRLSVGPLAGTTLPSPPGTVLSLDDWPVVWDQRTALPIRNDGRTVRDASIRLMVLPPPTRAEDLREASRQPVPPGRRDLSENLVDPEPLTGPVLADLASEITAGAATPFDAALLLQRWFTSEGGFAYSTSAVSGSDESALNEFLEERVGYCEQFAATMALMARSVGIPARVVVGFTQGRTFGADRWVVRGTDAHAWPELWMGSAGWVRFEPTPGAPSAVPPDYTRDTTSDDAPSTAPDESISAAPVDEDQRPTRELEELDGAASEGSGGAPSGWWVLGALAVAAALAPMVARARRRRRRMGRGTGEDAYQEVVDTSMDLGAADPEGPTPRATMGVLATRVDDARARTAMSRILTAVEADRYGAPGTDGGSAGSAGARASMAGEAQVVVTAMRLSAGRAARVRAALLPRSLLPRRSAAGAPDGAGTSRRDPAATLGATPSRGPSPRAR